MMCFLLASSRSGCLWVASESFLNTFSTTITAPSTMMPKSIAPSDSRLAGMPLMDRPMKVASNESGMMSATMAAARKLPRKTNNTTATSTAPSTRFLNTVVSVVLISHVRS